MSCHLSICFCFQGEAKDTNAKQQSATSNAMRSASRRPDKTSSAAFGRSLPSTARAVNNRQPAAAKMAWKATRPKTRADDGKHTTQPASAVAAIALHMAGSEAPQFLTDTSANAAGANACAATKHLAASNTMAAPAPGAAMASHCTAASAGARLVNMPSHIPDNTAALQTRADAEQTAAASVCTVLAARTKCIERANVWSV